jgi:hypothetical protein
MLSYSNDDDDDEPLVSKKQSNFYTADNPEISSQL